ncbi:MAG: hypothetical protein N2323_00375 [candidate division WOR-3 bacterium]|nr:hypothetical protein [candidate division WOR-3 bacterium]MDW8114545.1 hypothetical protein [candidate division WOR-3 bacterium]
MSYQIFNSFLTGQFLIKIKEDLFSFRIFSKEDLKAIAYYHTRRYFLTLPNWLVRMGLNIKGRIIDLGIFYQSEIKALVQCEFGIFLNQPNYFPEDKFNQSLKNLIETIELLNKQAVGYLLTIYESTNKYYLPSLPDKNFYQWLAINVAEFSEPQKWRKNFEDLVGKFIDKI